MKTNIHPTWHNQATVTCSCGNTFTTGSTLDTIKVDICSNCHPFYTGEMRFVDTQGRVEKFQAKMKQAQAYQSQAKGKKQAQSKRESQKSLKDMLQELKSKNSPAKDSKEVSPKKA